MTARTILRHCATLAPPVVILGLLVLVLGMQMGALPPLAPHLRTDQGMAGPDFAPDTVTISPRPYLSRATGTYMREDGAILDPPQLAVPDPPPLAIMRHEVSVAEYQRCVDDGACMAADLRPRTRGPDLPVTGISHDDAVAYATWLSGHTGQSWRLPTIAEWDFAAGSRAPEEALGLVANAANPALRWIATYEQETALGGADRADPPVLGTGGINEFGVADMAGPVWEWTDTCSGRVTVDAAGKVLRRLDSCGAHYLAGRHRAIMSDFIRDGATGGCATGRPPDNLGFRLVRAGG